MNMKEIARRVGVSSATVSRVINGSSLVRERTAARVRETLAEVDFIPNPSGTTLKYGRSKTYGLVIPDITNPFFAEFLGVFEDLVTGIDHELLVTVSQSSEKLEKNVRRMLMRQVDGVIFMASEFDTRDIEALFRSRIPLVTVDRRVVQEGCSDVSIDFNIGFKMAVDHLFSLGHRQIGFIGGMQGLRTSRERLNAYQKALLSVGLKFDKRLVRHGDYRLAGGEEGATSLMTSDHRPTAILAANDMTAFGAARALAQLRVRVPADVSLVGLDDVLIAEILQPPLTTIRIPRKELADECLKALNYSKENIDALGKRFSVKPELKMRQSTAPVSKMKKPR